MGQYYKIVNIDKQEFLNPHDFDCGSKLMEWSYSKTKIVLSLLELLATRWKGDRVYVVGDYADTDDESEPFYNTLKSIKEELKLSNSYLYSHVYDNFNNISKDVIVPDEDKYNFIYNHSLKKYIDLNHCPIDGIWEHEDNIYIRKIAPLPLLLAMGNGRGGGDFHYHAVNGIEHVGTWTDSVKDIEILENKLDNDYEEFCPDFAEDEIIPYTDEAKLISELKNK